MSTVQVDLPEEMLALAKAGDDHSHSAAKLIALELFRERRISAGKASEFAGMPLEAFLEFSAAREVPMNVTLQDWEQDQATIRELNL